MSWQGLIAAHLATATVRPPERAERDPGDPSSIAAGPAILRS
jgi:hypothetical protein